MKERRKRIMKRLLFEELENRAMLSADPLLMPGQQMYQYTLGAPIYMQASALTTNSYQDFYKSQVGTEVGGPGGVGMLDTQWVTLGNIPAKFGTGFYNYVKADEAFPWAERGLGQMTITTGANTPGISSFATPTAGPSRAGGTGNPALSGTIDPVGVDQALLELGPEISDLLAGKSKTSRKRDAEPQTPTFDFASEPAEERELELAGV